MDVTGVVEYVGQKGPYHSVKLDNGTWYGFGKRKPKCKKGDEVSFEYDENDRGYNDADPDTLEILSASAKPASSGKASSAGGMSRDQYWENKEKRDIEVQAEIRLQASRNAAIEVVKIAVENEAVAFPKSGTAGKRFDVIVAKIAGLTEEFYNETLAVDPTKKAKPAATPVRDEVEDDGDFDE